MSQTLLDKLNLTGFSSECNPEVARLKIATSLLYRFPDIKVLEGKSETEIREYAAKAIGNLCILLEEGNPNEIIREETEW